MKSKINKTNAFLLEIILDLIIFSVLLTISLHMIMKAHSLTNQTSALYEAVDICESITDLYESGDGGLDNIESCYPELAKKEDGFVLYLNKDFEPVNSYDDSARYHVLAENTNDIQFDGTAIMITVYDEKGTVIHEQKACNYKGGRL